MSADSYSVCPACWKKGEAEYLHPEDKANPLVPVFDERGTVEEYYEYFLREDGTLLFSYSGTCRKCKTQYSTDQNINPIVEQTQD